MKKNILLIFAAICSFVIVSAQTPYKLTAAKNMIKGTSTLHDWQCVVENQTGSATINASGKFSVSALKLEMDVKSIKSVKEDGSYYDESMDRNTYKALKADAFPQIVYTLTNISNIKTNGKTSTFTAKGNLTVAETTKSISFPVSAVVAGNQVVFTGRTKFKMSLFGIKPPTALMGTIKTGDEITLVLNTTFSK